VVGPGKPLPDTAEDTDQRRSLAELYGDLRTTSGGLSSREADRRRLIYGANVLTSRSGARWPGELLAVVAVILLNAGFAFVKEMQA
jgi:hypothetical protein